LTGSFVFKSNSVLFAERPQTFLANSITAHCIPRHIPKKGIFFSRAYFIVLTFPSIPLYPNPPGTRIPSASDRYLSGPWTSISSESNHCKFTRASFAMPPWVWASIRLLYESLSPVYFPTIAILTSFFGSLIFLTTSFHQERVV